MITSYAQNFEDVILWRALNHVRDGFYIDIGAQDPFLHSVSLAFYEKGWRGVHVEPTSQYAGKLRDSRPEEEVIQAAIGNGYGLLTFYEVPETGLSTGSELIAMQHEQAGHNLSRVTVPLITLSALLDRFADRQIHWLKIDVEGMEAAVIESWQPSHVRPWIVVIESTWPLSRKVSHETWDARIKDMGYEHVYFDGLNRFYVHKDHSELIDSFGPGPNCFDEFVLPIRSDLPILAPISQRVALLEDENASLIEERKTIEASLSERISALEELVASARETIEDLRKSVARSEVERTTAGRALATREAQISALRTQLEAVVTSSSWRVTWPLRKFVAAGRALLRFSRVRARLVGQKVRTLFTGPPSQVAQTKPHPLREVLLRRMRGEIASVRRKPG